MNCFRGRSDSEKTLPAWNPDNRATCGIRRKVVRESFWKIGNVLWAFANGWDEDPVCKEGYEAPIKSIGNSTTTPRDLENDLDVWIIQIALAESVAARLRKHGF